jgi:hypothetical protein
MQRTVRCAAAGHATCLSVLSGGWHQVGMHDIGACRQVLRPCSRGPTACIRRWSPTRPPPGSRTCRRAPFMHRRILRTRACVPLWPVLWWPQRVGSARAVEAVNRSSSKGSTPPGRHADKDCPRLLTPAHGHPPSCGERVVKPATTVVSCAGLLLLRRRGERSDYGYSSTICHRAGCMNPLSALASVSVPGATANLS